MDNFNVLNIFLIIIENLRNKYYFESKLMIVNLVSHSLLKMLKLSQIIQYKIRAFYTIL